MQLLLERLPKYYIKINIKMQIDDDILGGKEKMRIKFIDIAKGIAIICIVLGHLGINEINSFVFTFHVPIFFIITGYFINDKVPIKEFISKKYKTLIIPYIITCIIIILLATIKSIIATGLTSGITTAGSWLYASLYGAGDSYTTPFYIKAIGAIWFLLASFWASIFLRFSLEFKTKKQIIIVLLLFLIGFWSRKLFWFPLSIQAGCCATLFMYVGNIFKRIENNLKNLNFNIKLLLTIIALIVWIQFIINFKSFWFVHCDIGRGIIDIIGAICGSYIILLLSFLIEKYLEKIGKILAFLGENSLYILCIHIIELNLFEWYKIVTFFIRVQYLTYQAYIFWLIVFKFMFIFISTYIFSKYLHIKNWGRTKIELRN